MREKLPVAMRVVWLLVALYEKPKVPGEGGVAVPSVCFCCNTELRRMYYPFACATATC
jgi:hypothetical protein